MARKQRERYKDRVKAEAKDVEAKPSLTPEALRKRRNRRFLFLGIVAISFPILELIAYQFRAITITISNRSDERITGIRMIYTGGEFTAPELKPGGSTTRVVRPDFTFKGDHFATYLGIVSFTTADGARRSLTTRLGSIDFSATERYTFEAGPPNEPVLLKHSTSPGFPLSTIRDLLARLGIG